MDSISIFLGFINVHIKNNYTVVFSEQFGKLMLDILPNVINKPFCIIELIDFRPYPYTRCGGIWNTDKSQSHLF